MREILATEEKVQCREYGYLHEIESMFTGCGGSAHTDDDREKRYMADTVLEDTSGYCVQK